MTHSQLIISFRTKQVKIKIISKGQFIGIEDAVVKYSKGVNTKFSYNAVCQSAEVLCFYFGKEKAFDKLCNIGSLQYIIQYAKLNISRMEELIKNSLNIDERLNPSEVKPSKVFFGSIIASQRSLVRRNKMKQQDLKEKENKIFERNLTILAFGSKTRSKV